MKNIRLERIFDDIYDERVCQNLKWGRDFYDWPAEDSKKYLVLAEEVGEVAKALLENESKEDLYKELIQIAAVCMAWCEDIKKFTVCDREVDASVIDDSEFIEPKQSIKKLPYMGIGKLEQKVREEIEKLKNEK